MAFPEPRPEAIGGLLYQAHRLARAAANEAMRPCGIELQHLGVLSCVAENGPQSQRQLGDVLGLDKSAVVRIVDELERQGLAVRKQSRRDRRSNEVAVTAEGRRRRQAGSERAGAAMDELLAPLAPGERGQLAELLARFTGREQPGPAQTGPAPEQTGPAPG